MSGTIVLDIKTRVLLELFSFHLIGSACVVLAQNGSIERYVCHDFPHLAADDCSLFLKFS